MKSIIVTSALIVTIAVLFAIGSSPLVFAASSAPSGISVASPNSSASPLLVKVPVSLSFSPKTITLKASATCTAGYYCATNTLTVTNTGSAAIKFTGCTFFYKLSSSTTYTKGGCSFTAPITVPAHFVGTLKWLTSAIFGTHAGTYNAKVTWVNSVDKSGTGIFNYIVP